MQQITSYASGAHMAKLLLASKDGTSLFETNKSPASMHVSKGQNKVNIRLLWIL
jgi:hypothetical protein